MLNTTDNLSGSYIQNSVPGIYPIVIGWLVLDSLPEVLGAFVAVMVT
jgi:hypothetical protein